MTSAKEIQYCRDLRVLSWRINPISIQRLNLDISLSDWFYFKFKTLWLGASLFHTKLIIPVHNTGPKKEMTVMLNIRHHLSAPGSNRFRLNSLLRDKHIWKGNCACICSPSSWAASFMVSATLQAQGKAPPVMPGSSPLVSPTLQAPG